MTRVLFVEDDEIYRNNIVEVLEFSDYEVTAVANAVDAMEILYDYSFDLVITDIQMEGMDGIRFVKYVKKIMPDMKIIILTGNASANTELESIQLDVNRYLDKSLRIDVMLKYIEHTLSQRNAPSNDEGILKSEAEELIVDKNKREVKKKGELVHLTHKEFDILCFFLENKGYAINRETFIEEIWSDYVGDVDLRSIDTHVKILRKKLQTVSIVSIRGFGYKWSE